jgi:dipeptidase E
MPSIRAVLYSDQVIAANGKVDAHLLRLLAKPSPRIGYIPSAPDPERRFLREKQAYYARYGLTGLGYLEPDDFGASWDEADLRGCDAIHLTGGNTRHYLDRLRQAGLIEMLRRYALYGGLLIGTSAGAILMTPDIAVDALLQGRDPARSIEGSALDLLPFEFFPHLRGDPAYLPALIAYSRSNAGRAILAAADGDGVVVEDGKAMPVGDLLFIRDGQSQPLREPMPIA